MKLFIHKLFKKLSKLITMNGAEINAKLDALDAAITTERQQFLDTIAGLNQQVTDLQNQLANAITPTDADAIGARIDTSTTQVGTIVP